VIDFKASYVQDDALSFLSRFLPEDFKKIIEENIILNFKSQFIERVTKLGETKSLQDLHVFEIVHGSENDPRVGLSRDAFRILANFGVRKALIFFVSKRSSNYRLSLITLDLKLGSGKKVDREYSNPRRYSFFLGSDARVHTPHNFLVKKGMVKDLADLLSRFDVEVVTKEFFTNYKGLFENIRVYFEKDHGFKNFVIQNNIDINTFAKKLLGQIVFCYFLQRKGWLGARKGEPISNGDKDFMRSMFNHCAGENKNFYNDYLEYLFYGSLNNKTESSGDFYRKHFDCQIPFLNGGLFEPLQDYDWEKSFIHLPDRIFSNGEKTGILDVFDLYNFTVYEDDPIDREVSVDPEMLGKVFENLLPENLRKGQGAYYTPREIVHYMCQESLVNYLVTETKINIDEIRFLISAKQFENQADKEAIDIALQNIKVCDPACGSGAFLVGMLHEIVSARHILNPKEYEYQLKKDTIQNCIYGVDIDPGAVEIAKLRLWLSLVVDYELKEIEPFPNLDYKIMCGNSLLEELVIGEESIKLFDEKLLKKESIKIEREQTKNNTIDTQIKEKQEVLFRLKSLSGGLTGGKVEKIKSIEKEIKLLQKKLGAGHYNQEVGQKDFYRRKDEYFKILGDLHNNYFTEYDPIKKREKRKQIENIETEFIKSSIKEKVDDLENRIKNLNMQDPVDRKQHAVLTKKKLEYLVIPDQIHNLQTRPYFLWKLNFFEVFQEKNGFDIVIANPPYVNISNLNDQDRQNYKSRYTITKNKVDLYAYFIERGSHIIKYNGTLSYIIPHTWKATASFSKLRELIFKLFKLQIVVELDYKTFDATVKPVVIVMSRSIGEKYYINVLNAELKNINKIDIKEVLKDPNLVLDTLSSSIDKELFYKIEQGSLPLGKICKFTRGVKTSDDKRFIKKEALDKDYRKVIRGRDIVYYGYHWSGEFIWYRPDLMKEKTGCLPHSKKLFEVDEKIMLQRISGGICGCYDSEQVYGLDTCLISNTTTLDKNYALKFILALLNSRLLNFWYHKKFILPTVSGYELHQVPIKSTPYNEQHIFISFVDKIISITQSDDYMASDTKQSKVEEYERQIDQRVYKLYNLKSNEIDIVEKGLAD